MSTDAKDDEEDAVSTAKSEPLRSNKEEQYNNSSSDNRRKKDLPPPSVAGSAPARATSAAWPKESYEIPIRDAAPSSSRRPAHQRSPNRRRPQHRSRSRSKYGDDDDSTRRRQAEPELEKSLHDRIAESALSGTIEMLKLVGGVTLQTTGAVMAPPLHVTRTVVLPTLYAGIVDYIKSISPDRLKDWFRILRSSIYHFVNTLKNTSSGHAFRSRLLITLSDLIECLSADTTRQLLVDGMATTVKFSEALHTPEFRAFLDAAAVTGCRWVDAAADGRNKLLLQDLSQTVWSACELLADPAATTAWAEVTAYLCYALEMEQEKQEEYRRNNAAASQQRRRERNRYQAAVIDKDTFDANPDMTIEEVILSSLGGGQQQNAADDTDSVPSRIEVGTVTPIVASTTSAATDWDQQSSSIRQTVEKKGNIDDSDNDGDSVSKEWHERARSCIDKQFLRDGIEQRAVQVAAVKQNRKHTAPVETVDKDKREETYTGQQDVEDLDVVTSVHGDDDNERHAANLQKRYRREKAHLKVSTSPSNDSDKVVGFKSDDDQWAQAPPPNPLPREGETSSQHFHRVLDEILTQKRKEAVLDAIKAKKSGDSIIPALKTLGSIRRPRKNPTFSSGTVKERLDAIRAELGRGLNKEAETLKGVKAILGKKENAVILMFGAILLFVVLFWVCFGCYGVYVYFRPAAATFVSGSSKASQEIVIRVVKEVVHVDAEGKVLGKGFWNKNEDITTDEYTKIAQCVANLYE